MKLCSWNIHECGRETGKWIIDFCLQFLYGAEGEGACLMLLFYDIEGGNGKFYSGKSESGTSARRQNKGVKRKVKQSLFCWIEKLTEFYDRSDIKFYENDLIFMVNRCERLEGNCKILTHREFTMTNQELVLEGIWAFQYREFFPGTRSWMISGIHPSFSFKILCHSTCVFVCSRLCVARRDVHSFRERFLFRWVIKYLLISALNEFVHVVSTRYILLCHL